MDCSPTVLWICLFMAVVPLLNLIGGQPSSDRFETTAVEGGCKAVTGEDCQFPFKYGGRMIYKCTRQDSVHSQQPWCAVEVDEKTREVIPWLHIGRYADCSNYCSTGIYIQFGNGKLFPTKCMFLCILCKNNEMLIHRDYMMSCTLGFATLRTFMFCKLFPHFLKTSNRSESRFLIHNLTIS